MELLKECKGSVTRKVVYDVTGRGGKTVEDGEIGHRCGRGIGGRGGGRDMSPSSPLRLGATPETSGRLRCRAAWDQHGLQVRKRDSRVSIIAPDNREGPTFCGENRVRRRGSNLRRTKSLSDALNFSRPDVAIAEVMLHPSSDETRVGWGSVWRDELEPFLVSIVCSTREGGS